MSFLRFQDCRLPPPKPAHPPPQRPAALLAFRSARLCPCTLSSFSGTVSPGDVFLTVPRLPPAPSKTSAPSPAASSGFASLSTYTALSLHFAPRSFSGTVSQALQRPLAFLAFTVGTAASSGFSTFQSGLSTSSVQCLF